MKKTFLRDCTTFTTGTVCHLENMIDTANEITWRTFIKHVDIEEIRALFPTYDWKGAGLHIKDDYAVSFYKSTFRNKPCCYLVHSSIEYIFT